MKQLYRDKVLKIVLFKLMHERFCYVLIKKKAEQVSCSA